MISYNTLPLSKEQLFSWLSTVSNQYSTGAVIIDTSSDKLPIVYYNKAFAQLSGYADQQLIGQSLTILSGDKTDSEIEAELFHHLKHNIANDFTILQYTKDFNAFWSHLTLHPMQDEEGNVPFVFMTCEDQTDLMLNKMLAKLEREVYAELEFDDDLQHVLQVISEQIEKHYVREAFCTIQLIQHDQTYKIFGNGSIPISLSEQLCAYASSSNTDADAISVKNYMANDYPGLIENFPVKVSWTKPILNQFQTLGSVSLYFKHALDLKQTDIKFLNRLTQLISLSLKYSEQKQQLKKLAYYDISTNIPNAHYFNRVLDGWIEDKQEGFISIILPTEYSHIVDLYGRATGDELLKQMVDRIKQQTTPQDEFIARFTNSSIIIANKSKLYDVNHYDSRMLPLTATPYFIGESEIYITLKVGIGYFSPDLKRGDCIRHADLALSKSRNKSGTSIAIFEEGLDLQLQQKMDTLNQLTYGLQHDEFTIHLQPKINLQSWEIEGFEALSRWYSHKLGHVSPADFIPVAEQSGKIKEIDTLVIKKVLNWQQQRLAAGLKTVPIAVNISPDHFYNSSFIPDFFALLQSYDVPSKYIKLEVTESIELVDFTKAKEILSLLKEAGIDSSIDDFGVGFSSLSYLPKLPFNEIKIDRSFVMAMGDSGMHAVVQTIVQLAKNLQMKAVAEGIETIEQFNMLIAMGCSLGQGYFFYKPMPLEEAAQLLIS